MIVDLKILYSSSIEKQLSFVEFIEVGDYD